jgi:two-component sensor histidine kinase
MLVGEAGATALAMVLHELATNSVKYGALSCSTGTLDVAAVASESEVTITWTERGGPVVVAPTELGGFGSKLLIRTMTSQLKGSADYNWSEGGAIVALRMAKDRLVF